MGIKHSLPNILQKQIKRLGYFLLNQSVTKSYSSNIENIAYTSHFEVAHDLKPKKILYLPCLKPYECK